MGHKTMQNIHKQSKITRSQCDEYNVENSTLRADFVDVSMISKTTTALPRLQADSPFTAAPSLERELHCFSRVAS